MGPVGGPIYRATGSHDSISRHYVRIDKEVLDGLNDKIREQRIELQEMRSMLEALVGPAWYTISLKKVKLLRNKLKENEE